MSAHRVLFLILAVGTAALCVTLALQGLNILQFWFQSLTPVQQYWAPKLLITGLVLLGAAGGVRPRNHRAGAELAAHFDKTLGLNLSSVRKAALR